MMNSRILTSSIKLEENDWLLAYQREDQSLVNTNLKPNEGQSFVPCCSPIYNQPLH